MTRLAAFVTQVNTIAYVGSRTWFQNYLHKTACLWVTKPTKTYFQCALANLHEQIIIVYLLFTIITHVIMCLTQLRVQILFLFKSEVTHLQLCKLDHTEWEYSLG